MFNIFKKNKPKLSEMIPSGFVDIHSHILPGIDDGAKNIDESIYLIKKMKDLGFSKIIGTPHTYPGLYDNTSRSIKSSFDNLIKNISDNVIISHASEYLIESSLIQKAENKTLLCLKNNIILIEMSFISPPINLFDIIFQLKTNGYELILAHPERYRFLYDDLKKFHKLKNLGCKFQINLLSLVDFYGKEVTQISEKILKENLVDYVGSDVHNAQHISFFEKVIKIGSVETLEKVIQNNLEFI